VIYRGQQLPNGYIADAVYLFLDDLYLRNLNAQYTVPIDWNLWERLNGDIAQRMYEILSLDSFLAFERKVRELRIQEPGASFSEIFNKLPHYLGRISFEKCYRSYCQYFPIAPQNTRWRARQQLASAHAQLAKERYFYLDPNLEGKNWQIVPGQPQNWRIRYYVGKKAFDEYWQAKRRFLSGKKEEPRFSRASRSLSSPVGQKTKPTPSPHSSPDLIPPRTFEQASESTPIQEESAAQSAKFLDRYRDFIQFLEQEGVVRAKQLVESSPHSIEILEIIKEDYLRF
jgi:hypothetical protein